MRRKESSPRRAGVRDEGREKKTGRLHAEYSANSPDTQSDIDDEALDFLQWLRPPDGPWLLIAIKPDGDTRARWCETEDDAAAFIEEWDGKRNLYYALNRPVDEVKETPKKPSKDETACAEFLHADCDPEDDETPEEAKKRYLNIAETFDPKPSGAIDSGNGIQFLWALDEPLQDPLDAEAFNLALLNAFGAHAGTQNCDRILRLPGTINLPNAKKRKAGRTKCDAHTLWLDQTAYPISDFETDNSQRTKKGKAASPNKKTNGKWPKVEIEALPLTDDWKALITKGVGMDRFKSRSEPCWHVAHELLRHNVDEDIIMSVLLDADNAISEHILDQGDPERAAWRAIENSKNFSQSPSDAPPFSESALALEFADRYSHELRYVHAWGKWMRWDGKRWQHEQTLLTFNYAHEVCREAAQRMKHDSNHSPRPIASSKTVAGVVNLARADRRLAATVDMWDADPWLLNTPGGVVGLRTGEICEAVPEDYMTKITAVAPDARCSIELWESILRRSMDDDMEMVAYLKRLFGYALTGITRESSLAFWHGEGANGKTVIIEAASGAMGDYHTITPMETFLASRNEHHPTEIADLCGARLVTAVETDEGRRWDAAKIKALTGGDTLKARFMRKDFFSFKPQFTPIVHGNQKPKLRSLDEAIRRRLHVVPFEVVIPKEERDPHLSDKLTKEWPGILSWMIEGCLEWQERQLDPPARVVDASEAYFESQDAVSRWIDEACVVNPNVKTPRTHLWNAWKEWATDSGEWVGRSSEFYEELEKRGFDPIVVKGTRRFRGICLN